VTVKGVKSCCILNVVDGTDGAMLWNVSSEEDGNFRGVCVCVCGG